MNYHCEANISVKILSHPDRTIFRSCKSVKRPLDPLVFPTDVSALVQKASSKSQEFASLFFFLPLDCCEEGKPFSQIWLLPPGLHWEDVMKVLHLSAQPWIRGHQLWSVFLTFSLSSWFWAFCRIPTAWWPLTVESRHTLLGIMFWNTNGSCGLQVNPLILPYPIMNLTVWLVERLTLATELKPTGSDWNVTFSHCHGFCVCFHCCPPALETRS